MSTSEALGKKKNMAILKKVDELCTQNGLTYTLLFETLLSQELEQDYAGWLSFVSIGLLYPDYLKLIEAVEKDEEIYVLNRQKDKDYNALYSQICKRSRVVLPKGREKDQPYYDYSVWVYPILYVGDSQKEYQEYQNKLKYYQRFLEIRENHPFEYRRKYKKLVQENRMWCKRRDEEKQETEEFFELLFKRAKMPSKFVLIPGQGELKGRMCEAEMYMRTKRGDFGGLTVSCMQEKEEWLNLCFTQEEKNKITTTPANRALVEGPEIVRRVQLVALEMLCEVDRICRKHDIKYILAAGTQLGAARHKGFVPWDDDVDIAMLHEEWLRFKAVAEEELDKERFFLRTQDTDKDMNLVFFQIKRNGTMYVKGGREQFDTHRGIAMDIFPLFNAPDSIWLTHVQNNICMFFKTMTWAHMGSGSERKPLLRFYYNLLAKVSNKTSYAWYYKIATAVKKKKPYLTYLSTGKNQFHAGFNQRRFFEDLTELEFEGHSFFVPKDYEEFLGYFYGRDYMKPPVPLKRVNAHLPAKIELNGLYSFDTQEKD